MDTETKFCNKTVQKGGSHWKEGIQGNWDQELCDAGGLRGLRGCKRDKNVALRIAV